MRKLSSVVAGLFFAVILVSALAQDDAGTAEPGGNAEGSDSYTESQPRVKYPPSHPLTNMAPSHPEVETAFAVVKHAENNLPLGEDISVLCGFVNNGEAPLNITGIMGSINNPQQFSFYVVNLTFSLINETVPPTTEMTFEYKFKVPEQLDPMEWQLALTVFYGDETSGYTSTFLNKTVTFYEASGRWNIDAIIKFTFAVGIVVPIALFLYMPSLFKSKPQPTETPQVDDSWADVLNWKATHGNPKGKAKSAKSSGRSKKKASGR